MPVVKTEKDYFTETKRRKSEEFAIIIRISMV